MTRPLNLDDFGADADLSAPEPDTDPGQDLESMRLDAYEEGYKSGWDDSRAAQSKSDTAIADDLAQAIRDANFSYHEARGDVLAAIRPVIEAIVEQVLPSLARGGLAAAVTAELIPALEQAAHLDCELVAAPDTIPILVKLMEDVSGLEVKMRPEPTFSPAQVSLRMGAETREVDLSRAVAEIGRELDQFTQRLIAEPKGADAKGAAA